MHVCLQINSNSIYTAMKKNDEAEKPPPSWWLCMHSVKLFAVSLATSAVVLTLYQIHTLHDHHSYPNIINNMLPNLNYHSWRTRWSTFPSAGDCRLQQQQQDEISSARNRLRQSVTFLPLKDLRYSKNAQKGHTWFMSSLNDIEVAGEVKYLQIPSESSKGRLLCVKGKDIHDGAWNYYALAWREVLPENATLMKGLTFMSYNHYVYGNIWHALSAVVVPFTAWHLKNGCKLPQRWVLYYMGELRAQIAPWDKIIMEAVYGTDGVKIEGLEGVGEETPVCFEEAVVMRHSEGGMSRERRERVYDLLRCKAREHCDVKVAEPSGEKAKQGLGLRVSMLMRSGARSFKNDTHVIHIFEKECRRIQGCRLQVAYSNNLTVCQQVKLMSETDVLISPHGAQMSNMFLMDKGGHIMELYPKGWLKLFGVGQYIYKWLADWSGMHHQGVWRDPDGPTCQYPEDDVRCMDVFKDAQIGHNATHFSQWARTVFNEARTKKLEEVSHPKQKQLVGCGC